MGETKAATQFGWSVPTDYWMIRANGLFSLSHLELLGIGVYRSYVLIYNVLSNLSLSHPDLMIWITILVQLCFSIRLYLWGLLNLSWAFMSYRRSPEFGEHSGNYSETVTKPLDFFRPKPWSSTEKPWRLRGFVAWESASCWCRQRPAYRCAPPSRTNLRTSAHSGPGCEMAVIWWEGGGSSRATKKTEHNKTETN